MLCLAGDAVGFVAGRDSGACAVALCIKLRMEYAYKISTETKVLNQANKQSWQTN
jgi:hypothetical protein